MEKPIDVQNAISKLEHKSRLHVYLTLFETLGASVASYVLVKDISDIFGDLAIIVMPGCISLISKYGINKIENIQSEINNLKNNKTKVKCINSK